MSTMVRRAMTAAVVLAALAAVPLAAQEREARLLRDAAAVFEQILQVPEREVPEAMLEKVQGIAVFPGLRKLGLVVGLQRGRGVLIARTEDGRWAAPLVVTLSGVTVGWQVGIQSVDLVLFFRTTASVDRVLQGGMTLGVDAGVAAGSVGRQAGAATDAELRSEILTYARSRGFFAGVTLASADIEPDEAANAALYGRRGIPPGDILAGRGIAVPRAAAALIAAIERVTAGRR